MRGSAVFRTGIAPGGALAPGWVKNELWRKARTVPSLDLRFADNKSLVDAVTGAQLVTFTRASSGTFVGSDGLIQTAATNEARSDHDPTTGQSLGLLVEEARTNLALRSEEFNDVAWTKTNSTVTADGAISPDGTMDADKIVSNSASLGFVVQSVSQTTGTSYTWSVFAKAGEYSFCQLRITGTVVLSITRAYFNLATGTTTGTANCTASITAFGNGWYKCSITYTTILAATASPRFYGQVDAADTVGDGTSGIYIWGAQMEAGAFPTSYIPTTTATVTRSADVASITGANFSSWYNQTEGSFYGSFLTPYVAPATAGQTLFSVNDGTANNRNLLSKRANADVSTRWSNNKTGGTDTAFINIGTWTANPLQTAVVYKENDYAGSLSGAVVGTDATVNLATNLNVIELGTNLSASYLNGTIKRLTYWPVRLANPTLQAISAP